MNKVRTTDKNLLLLIRGASWVWQRLQEAPSDIRSVFIVGDQNDTYPVGKGDGTVNLSSASLYNTLNWPSEDHLNVDLDHGEITEINIPPTGAHALILNKIKALLEH